MDRSGGWVSNNNTCRALSQLLLTCNALSPQQSDKAGVSPPYKGDRMES